MIKWIRYRYNVPSRCLMHPEELTVKQLADRLAVSIHYVHYWIKHGVIEARQLDGRGPWWITISDQQEQQLRDHVRRSAHLQNRRKTMRDVPEIHRGPANVTVTKSDALTSPDSGSAAPCCSAPSRSSPP